MQLKRIPSYHQFPHFQVALLTTNTMGSKTKKDSLASSPPANQFNCLLTCVNAPVVHPPLMHLKCHPAAEAFAYSPSFSIVLIFLVYLHHFASFLPQSAEFCYFSNFRLRFVVIHFLLQRSIIFSVFLLSSPLFNFATSPRFLQFQHAFSLNTFS